MAGDADWDIGIPTGGAGPLSGNALPSDADRDIGVHRKTPLRGAGISRIERGGGRGKLSFERIHHDVLGIGGEIAFQDPLQKTFVIDRQVAKFLADILGAEIDHDLALNDADQRIMIRQDLVLSAIAPSEEISNWVVDATSYRSARLNYPLNGNSVVGVHSLSGIGIVHKAFQVSSRANRAEILIPALDYLNKTELGVHRSADARGSGFAR